MPKQYVAPYLIFLKDIVTCRDEVQHFWPKTTHDCNRYEGRDNSLLRKIYFARQK